VNPLELVLILAVMVGLLFWMRGFSRIRRTFRQARSIFDTAKRIRLEVGRVSNPQGNHGPRSRDARTVDVTARSESASPVTICPVCGDRLNDAQKRALFTRSVRCPGSSRVDRECPYYGERTLN
jgi:hypothetical protein